MKILQKIFIPLVIFTLLFSNIGFNIVKHTCGSTGDITISFFAEELCTDDSCVNIEGQEVKVLENNNIEKSVQFSAISCCDNSTEVIDIHRDSEEPDSAVLNNALSQNVSNKLADNLANNSFNCCSNETTELGKIVEFTITTTPNFNLETNVVIAESYDYNVTTLNKNYELLIENINNKIKDIGNIILKYLLLQLTNTSSESEGNRF